MDPPAPAQATPGPSPAAQPLNQQMQQRKSLMPPPKQPSGLPGRGLAKAAGRPRKDWVRDQLGESNDCKHCHKVLSKNITYTAAHLLSCAKFLDSAAAISIGKEEEAVQQALRARSQQQRLITSASRTTTLLGSSSGASGSSASASQQWTGYSHLSSSMLEELQGEFAVGEAKRLRAT